MFQEFFQKAPELKSPREIGLMREAGKIVAEALAMCREMAKPGARSIEINLAVEALFARHGARPLFKNYTIPNVPVPFPASTCISFNEQVVHGIPGQREIRDGDLVKIDTACKLNGWCADAAITVPVGNVRPETAPAGGSRAAGAADRHRGNGPAPLVVGGGRPNAALRRERPASPW